MSLKYNAVWNSITDQSKKFWAFYADNRKEFDKILYDICWSKKRKYRNMVEVSDLYSELILSFHRSDFLEDFNPAKSSFGTFVTSRANGYAQHIITKIFSDIQLPKEDRTPDSQWVSYVNLDDVDLHEDSDIESQLTVEEIFQSAQKSFSEMKKKIVDLFNDGYKVADIAAVTSLTVPQILHNIRNYKESLIKKARIGGVIKEEKTDSKPTLVIKPKQPVKEVAFDHEVSASTLQYGITVPKFAHQGFSVPGRGQKRSVQIWFGNGYRCEAVIRTLDNDVERVQIRYKRGEAKQIGEFLSSQKRLKVSVIDNNNFKIN